MKGLTHILSRVILRKPDVFTSLIQWLYVKNFGKRWGGFLRINSPHFRCFFRSFSACQIEEIKKVKRAWFLERTFRLFSTLIELSIKLGKWFKWLNVRTWRRTSFSHSLVRNWIFINHLRFSLPEFPFLIRILMNRRRKAFGKFRRS